MNTLRRIFFKVAALFAGAALYSCATIGNPSGGPRDEDPPRFIKASPAPSSVNFSGNRAVIEFDEIVNVKDAFSKVVISPTSAETPRVSSLGRRVVINFSDSLQPNTTYTVDFGDAIQDNNEGNKLQGFSYTFATGPEIDTLRISGMVLAARDLEPQQGMLVGVYSSPHDSLFKTTRLERIAKTDDRGRFTIRGLKPGEYRLFALADVNNDYHWDNPQEDIAFTSFMVAPYSERIEVTDTIYDLKTGAVDSLVKRMRTRFLPNDILLNSFNINYKQQYLLNNERIDSTRIHFVFNAQNDSLPKIVPIGYKGATPGSDGWALLERSQHADTLTYWLTDPDLIARDTLLMAASYRATDTSKNLAWRTDTLKFITRRPRADKKKESREKVKKDSVAVVPSLKATISPAGTLDIDASPVLEFEQPIASINPDAFHLQVMKDTVWTASPHRVKLVPLDTVARRRYLLEFPKEFEGKYRITADTLAATGIYGLSTAPLKQDLTVKKQSDYFDMTMKITGLNDTVPAFVELLNAQDNPVRTATVNNGVAKFVNVPLGTYYARLVEDTNGNGLYDTGDYDSQRQPEYVYYYPQAIKIKKRWDVSQDWNITSTALDLQKPLAIKKNKSEDDKKRLAKQKEEESADDNDAPFDPNANPFDPNDAAKRRRNSGSLNSY